MVEAFMRDESKILKIEGPPGHTALLLDGKVVCTDEDSSKIFDMARDMEKSGDYKGREISVFWIFDTFPYYIDPWLKCPSLMRAYEMGINPFEGKMAEEAE